MDRVDPDTNRGAQITLEGVTRRYKPNSGPEVLALESVSLEITAGSAVALTGPSGSGKSTLLHLVGGMDRPDDGRVVVGNAEVSRMSNRQLTLYRRTIGFVFQRFHLLPALNVIDNVIAPVMPRRVGFDKTRRAQELLESVGLSNRATAMPSELSGGQQQRVAIARALLNRPTLVLADEPTGNLDTNTGNEIIKLMLDIRTEYGTTLIIATHNSAVAELSDREIKLVDGRAQ